MLDFEPKREEGVLNQSANNSIRRQRGNRFKYLFQHEMISNLVFNLMCQQFESLKSFKSARKC